MVRPRDLPHQTLDSFRHSIVGCIRDTFHIDLAPSAIELRYCDLDGDVFQVDHGMDLLNFLGFWRPSWRTRQAEFFTTTQWPIDSDSPFVVRLSCHKFDPTVILP